jgi:hypothetical protein
MNKLVLACIAGATLVLATAGDVNASWFGHGNCGGCAPQYYSNCGSCAPCVQYQQVWKEREDTVTVYTRVPREEKFEYTVCIPVTTQEARKVVVCNFVPKEVEFKYVVSVPHTTPVTRKVTQYTCEPYVVECEVPCYSTVMVSCCNPCGGISYCCQQVCTMQKVQRTMMKQVPHEVEVTVNVCTYEPVEKVGKRTVCERVMVEKEITVNVCHMTTEKRTGSRVVYDCVPSQRKVMVKYCELVPVVMQPAPVAVPVMANCDTCNTCYQPSGCFQGCSFGSCFRGCFSGCR